tara:strand:+ start:903 stop:1409 length:507 start_codon:yes stop_codon:yes gene_type:complete
MSNFVVLKILKKDDINQPNDLNITNEILYSSSKFRSSLNFIRNLETLEINEKSVYINSTHNSVPTNKDINGLFLVTDAHNDNKYHIYQKTTTEVKGYIYNSVDIKIENLGFLEIIKYQNQDICTKIQKVAINKKKSKKPVKDNNHHLNYKLIQELKEKLKKLQEKKIN